MFWIRCASSIKIISSFEYKSVKNENSITKDENKTKQGEYKSSVNYKNIVNTLLSNKDWTGSLKLTF